MPNADEDAPVTTAPPEEVEAAASAALEELPASLGFMLCVREYLCETLAFPADAVETGFTQDGIAARIVGLGQGHHVGTGVTWGGSTYWFVVPAGLGDADADADERARIVADAHATWESAPQAARDRLLHVHCGAHIRLILHQTLLMQGIVPPSDIYRAGAAGFAVGDA